MNAEGSGTLTRETEPDIVNVSDESVACWIRANPLPMVEPSSARTTVNVAAWPTPIVATPKPRPKATSPT